jgi:hypothetical protein
MRFDEATVLTREITKALLSAIKPLINRIEALEALAARVDRLERQAELRDAGVWKPDA